MQTKDIKIGGRYAYKQYKWATPEQAVVLETGVVFRVNAAYGSPKHSNGVRIRRIGSGTEAVVSPKTLVSTWKEHQAKAREALAYKQRLDQDRAERLAKNAALLVALNNALIERGAEVCTDAYTYTEEHADALRAAGLPETEGQFGHRFASVFYSLDDALKGQFASLDVLVPFLSSEEH